jgi:tRNA dimethylallyltransferase
MNNKTVVVIAGPTAVGKTGVAIAVAKQLGTEIISADSRQCYRELNIGVARPSEEDLAAVPHHFIASHSVTEKVTAATFEQYALEKVYGLFKKSNVVVMTGGTGLYLKAFCDGLDTIPEVPEEVHQHVINSYKENGLWWLQQQVQQLDPLFYTGGEIQNPQRLMRALEVYQATGRSIETFKKGKTTPRDFRIIKTALQLPKESLHHNINLRVDAMIENGLIEEVKVLVPYKHHNALQTVGYKEIFCYLDGALTREAAIAAIKQNTRQYAKRQLTWFRKDAAYQWFSPDAESLIQFLKREVRQR